MKYKSEYYSVIDINTGKKLCDCGEEEDALLMYSLDPKNRKINKNNFLMSSVIDIKVPNQLPTSEVVIVKTKTNKNVRLQLQQNDLTPLNL